MFEIIRKIVFVAGREQLPQYAVLIAMMLGAALLEAVGVGAVLPLLVAMSRPEVLLAKPIVHDILSVFNVPPDASHLVLIVGAAMIVVFVLKGILVVATTWFQGRVMHRQRAMLSRTLFVHYLHLPYDRYLKKNLAQVLHTISGVTANFSTVLMAALLLFGAEALVLLTVIMLLVLVNPTVTIASVIMLALAGAAYIRWSKPRLIRVGGEQHRAVLGLNKSVIEGLGSLKETRLLGIEGFFLRRFEQLALKYTKYSVQLHVFNTAPRLAAETFFVILIVGVVIYMTVAGLDLETHLPAMAVFAMAVVRLLPSFNRMLSAYNNARVTALTLSVLFAELEEAQCAAHPAAVANSNGRENSVITLQQGLRLEGVSYTYPDDSTKVLDCLSMEIRKGEVVGFIGKSGAGKTTLVDVILGLLEPQEGDILADGISVLGRQVDWRRLIGYIPQSIYLTDDTIRRNIAFGIEDTDIQERGVQDSVEAAQLGEFISSLPRGLETVVGDRGVRLSGGQRQRIGIARALYNDPELLVMDEATSALDVETEMSVNDAIRRLAKSKTILVIAHRLSTVSNCDRLFLLDAGKVVDSGTYSELLERNVWFRRINELVE